jgi:Icc-related predicted phosphoesterase
MKVICISDTHTRHKHLKVPDGDLLIHAGDITARGDVWQIRKFNKWLGTLPHKHKIVICGNHDLSFQDCRCEDARAALTNCIYLEDEAVDVEGLVVYGSPWQPWYHDWAFNIRRQGPELAKKWAQIPEETNILITHGPPFGILDWVKRMHPKTDPLPGVPRVGCQALAGRVKELKELKLHVFGHVHESYGYTTQNGVHFVNASSCTLNYKPINLPVVVDL